MDEECIYFVKLSLQLYDKGKLATSKVIEKCLEEEQSTFTEYLNRDDVIHKLYHLHKPDSCCRCINGQTFNSFNRKSSVTKDQWRVLFRGHKKSCDKGFSYSFCPCQFRARTIISPLSMDLTLSTRLLLEVFNLSKNEQDAIRTLQRKRNSSVAHASKTRVSGQEFKTSWAEVEIAICKLAERHSMDFKDEMIEELSDLFHMTLIKQDMCQRLKETIAKELDHLLVCISYMFNFRMFPLVLCPSLSWDSVLLFFAVAEGWLLLDIGWFVLFL